MGGLLPPTLVRTPLRSFPPSFQAYKRTNADETGTTSDFLSVQKDLPYASKTADLSYGHAGLYGCTDENGGKRRKAILAKESEVMVRCSIRPFASIAGRPSQCQTRSLLTDSMSGCIGAARRNISGRRARHGESSKRLAAGD